MTDLANKRSVFSCHLASYYQWQWHWHLLWEKTPIQADLLAHIHPFHPLHPFHVLPAPALQSSQQKTPGLTNHHNQIYHIYIYRGVEPTKSLCTFTQFHSCFMAPSGTSQIAYGSKQKVCKAIISWASACHGKLGGWKGHRVFSSMDGRINQWKKRQNVHRTKVDGICHAICWVHDISTQRYQKISLLNWLAAEPHIPHI